MKTPNDHLDPNLEADFPEVIDQLQLPDLQLRRERRAVVLAAFEQARAAANLPAERGHWSWIVGLAAAVVIMAALGYTILTFQRSTHDRNASTNASIHPAEEPAALCELNVALAIVNARAAAAEQELAWLTAMLAEGERSAQPRSIEPNHLNLQP